MTDHSDPTETVDRLYQARNAYVLWAPGATRYQVALLHIRSQRTVAESGLPFPTINALFAKTAEDTTLIAHDRPRGYADGWTATRWLDAGLPARAWPDVRPLLAALGWAAGDCSELAYLPAHDEREIDTIVRERHMAHRRD